MRSVLIIFMLAYTGFVAYMLFTDRDKRHYGPEFTVHSSDGSREVLCKEIVR